MWTHRIDPLSSLSKFYEFAGLKFTTGIILAALISCQQPSNFGESSSGNGTGSTSTSMPKSGLEMVLVAGGSFTMGGNDDVDDGGPVAKRIADECPHPVTLKSFYMAKYEVTQADWIKIMGTTGSASGRCDECPVSMVSWMEIQEFITKLNTQTGETYRLPTEQEWEFAAKGGVKSGDYLYAGSNQPEKVAWFADNSGGVSHPVGKLQPNELGIYDMSGNIWEYCSTLKSPYPCDNLGKDLNVPVLRGGTFKSRSHSVRVRDRNGRDKFTKLPTLGFRLAKSL